MKKIKRVKPGDSPTLKKASEANEIITALNNLASAEVHPRDFGIVKDGKTNYTLDLVGLQEHVAAAAANAVGDGFPLGVASWCQTQSGGITGKVVVQLYRRLQAGGHVPISTSVTADACDCCQLPIILGYGCSGLTGSSSFRGFKAFDNNPAAEWYRKAIVFQPGTESFECVGDNWYLDVADDDTEETQEAHRSLLKVKYKVQDVGLGIIGSSYFDVCRANPVLCLQSPEGYYRFRARRNEDYPGTGSDPWGMLAGVNGGTLHADNQFGKLCITGRWIKNDVLSVEEGHGRIFTTLDRVNYFTGSSCFGAPGFGCYSSGGNTRAYLVERDTMTVALESAVCRGYSAPTEHDECCAYTESLVTNPELICNTNSPRWGEFGGQSLTVRLTIIGGTPGDHYKLTLTFATSVYSTAVSTGFIEQDIYFVNPASGVYDLRIDAPTPELDEQLCFTKATLAKTLGDETSLPHIDVDADGDGYVYTP